MLCTITNKARSIGLTIGYPTNHSWLPATIVNRVSRCKGKMARTRQLSSFSLPPPVVSARVLRVSEPGGRWCRRVSCSPQSSERGLEPLGRLGSLLTDLWHRCRLQDPQMRPAPVSTLIPRDISTYYHAQEQHAYYHAQEQHSLTKENTLYHAQELHT